MGMLRWTHFHRAFPNLGIVLTACLCLSHALNLDAFDEKERSSSLGYGTDISFPMQRHLVSTNYPWLPHNVDPMNNPTPSEYIDMPIQVMGDRQKFYNEFLEGCKSYYGKYPEACQATEDARIDMALSQPESMQNYTDVGFKKIKTPDAVWNLLKDFWEHNKDKKKAENWHKGERERTLFSNGRNYLELAFLIANSLVLIQGTHIPITGSHLRIW